MRFSSSDSTSLRVYYGEAIHSSVKTRKLRIWCKVLLFKFIPYIANSGLEFSSQWTLRFGPMPHPMRETARGRLLYTVPVMLFMDDMSGNVSKQWNKHMAIYYSNAALPREIINKQWHVRFAAASPSAPPLELMQGIMDSM
jgi:hypothetical protein